MKTISRLFISLFLVVSMLGLILPSPATASNPPIPDEVEVYWEVSVNSTYAWSDENKNDEGKVIARSETSDSFLMQAKGTTQLERVGLSQDDNPFLRPKPRDDSLILFCHGGGTSEDWTINTLSNWDPETGRTETRDFESKTVTNWQYSMPNNGHDIDPEVDAVIWFEIIPPESDNEPVRYRMDFNPFFFIEYDTLSEYIDVSGSYHSTWKDFQGSHSESEELVNMLASGAADIAGQVWNHRVENDPLGSSIEGELTFINNEFKDSGSVKHTLTEENGRAEIIINYRINKKPSAKAIQPNQALGRYWYHDDSSYQPATDFVAGRDTVIQVFLPDEVKADEVNDMELDIYRDGNKVTTLTSFEIDPRNNALIFIPNDKSVCGNWAAGKYKFVARFEGTEKILDGVEFKERGDLRIMAVPILANYGGTVKTAPKEKAFADADDFIRQVFPLANENVKLEIGPHFSASDRWSDITTETGKKRVWIYLKKVLEEPYGVGYDAIVGFVPDLIPVVENGRVVSVLQGYTYNAPAVVVALDADYKTTLAHEIGHFYDLGDEYKGGHYKMDVNPPPLGYEGFDWDTGNKVKSGATHVQESEDGEGTLISVKLHPYEVGGRGLLKEDMTSFMGSGAPPSSNWTTGAIWQHLFNAFAGKSDASDEPDESDEPNTQALRAFNTSRWGGQVVAISGLISSTGIVEIVEPTFSYPSGDSFTRVEGTHSILALDAGGKVLEEQGFTPNFRAWSIPGKVQDTGVFSVDLPLPDGTVCLQIVEGDQLLHEIQVSPSAPSVSIINPLPGASLSGTVDLEWTASDADDDDLTYKVEYSPDGNRWLLLTLATSSTTFTADFSSLPGGDQAAIRVTATDGINSTRAIIDGLQVPIKAPEVYIQAPADGSSVVQGEGFFLKGRAYDPQAGWIYDSLVWKSDRDGELGRGSLVYAKQLSKGTHTITLQATGPSGQTSTQSVNLTVGSAGSDDKQDLGRQVDVPLDYTWTVTFNDQVDPATLTSANLQVLDANGDPVNIELKPGEDGKTALILAPKGGYLPGQDYSILVSKGIKSASGKALKSAYIKRFTTIS